jgi:hypothetical protein
MERMRRAISFTILLAAAIAAAPGCGAHPLVAGAASDASSDVSAPSSPDASPADATSAMPDAEANPFLDPSYDPSMFAVCVPGRDQTCNDNLAQSSLAGVCALVVAPVLGSSCTCNDGFSLNPKTQRCRAGATICLAAAADEWPIKKPLEHADCAARERLECANGFVGGGRQSVSRDLDALIQTCHPYAVWIRIEFTGGCPSLLEMGRASASDVQTADCMVAALATKRWGCAEDPSACQLYEYDTLIP